MRRGALARGHLILGLLFSELQTNRALAAEVAFLEVRDQTGALVQLEPAGRFAHVAIRVRAHWLHAHPATGVELSDDLEHFGKVSLILTNSGLPDPDLELAQRLVGRPYDPGYEWNSEKHFYCSKLVAKLLGVSPMPMRFDAQIWSGRVPPALSGQMGLSPDDLFRILLKTNGWKPATCLSATLKALSF